MTTTRVQELLERLESLSNEAVDLIDTIDAWGLQQHTAGGVIKGNLGVIGTLAQQSRTIALAERARFPIEAALAPRVGPFRVMRSGRRFWPLDPRADEVTPEDIAWHLSMLCRFNGSPSRFYGVAEHTLLVAGLAERRMRELHPDRDPAEVRPYAVLHDAPETYVGDIHRELRKVMRGWEPMEARLRDTIHAAFGLPIIPAELLDALTWADDAACVLEARVLHAPFDPEMWEGGLPQVEVSEEYHALAAELLMTYKDDPIAWPREDLLAELQPLKRAAEAAEVAAAQAAAEKGTEPEPGADGASWQDEMVVSITPVEWCKVCELDGKKAKAVESGLCADCVPF